MQLICPKCEASVDVEDEGELISGDPFGAPVVMRAGLPAAKQTSMHLASRNLEKLNQRLLAYFKRKQRRKCQRAN